MKQDSHIDFVLKAQIEGMLFDRHRPEGIVFTPTGDHGMRIILLPTDPDNDACGHRNGLLCKVYATYPATKDQALFVDSFNRNVMLRVADGIDLPFQRGGEILIDKDGTFKEDFDPRRYLCPQDISRLIGRVESELASKVNRFIRLLRWRQGIDVPDEIIRHSSLFWRVGNGNYPLAPLDGGGPSNKIELRMRDTIHWDEEHQTDLEELWSANDLTEPLGHALLREAAGLVTESPRSSILIMTAALETAVKMHISRIAPDTAWLMEELPSPPIFKVLRDYIPTIHRIRGKEIDFWDKVKSLIKKAQKLIELRNKVAHTGKIPEDAGSIEDYLVLVTDLLYLLDILDGHDWAKTLLSHPLRKELGWSSPKYDNSKIILTLINARS